MGWKRGVLFKAAGIIALFLVVVLAVFSNRTFNQNKSGSAECVTDADCVKVQTTCCSCAMGGKEVCAGKIQAENLTAKNCPSDLMCIAMYACQIKSCSCVQGKCEAVS
ncbi:hypothetical protein J4433_01525 [Candidatus Pacearchaeota archaeon]|nr:hypothetical protein [Candidatus Pacearchaeota archaeon]